MSFWHIYTVLSVVMLELNILMNRSFNWLFMDISYIEVLFARKYL